MALKKEHKKRNRMDAEHRRKQILDCATRLFGKNGYYQTQISDILQAAGVSRGTIYQYFKNKDDIFGAILENLYGNWKKILSELPPPGSDEYRDGKQFFIHQIKKTLRFFIENPNYCSILLNIGLGVNRNFDRFLRRLDEQMVDFIINFIRSGIKLGRIKPGINMELVSNMIGGSIMRVLYYSVVPQKDRPGFDLDLLTEQYVDAISCGIFLEKP